MRKIRKQQTQHQQKVLLYCFFIHTGKDQPIMNLNKYIDHTLLKADATEAQIIQLCQEAVRYDFYAVCVNGCYVPLAAKHLRRSDVKIAAVAGFPLGAMPPQAKAFEARNAIENGANEIDMVINIGALKDGRYDEVLAELSQLAELCHSHDATLKVILETCLLTKKEIRKACELCVKANADFVKTSTGFDAGGATVEDITLMKKTVSGKAKIKASGGIRTLQDALRFIDAGADRLGCSAGAAIMEEALK